MRILSILLAIVSTVGVAQEPSAIPDDFPRFIVPEYQEEMDRLRELYWLHYPGAGPKATLWDEWQAIRCPVKLMWGMQSKLLLEPVVRRMQSTGPRAEVFEVPYAGHCPRLENDEQIEEVARFLSLA